MQKQHFGDFLRFHQFRSTSIWALLALGGIVSILSFLESQLPWLAAVCGIFGSGCRQAAEFTVFTIPVALWGLAFYAVAAALYRLARPWTFWLIMAGVGAEATLVALMLTRGIVCIFCLFNALVMALLLILFIDRRRLWQSLAIALAAYVVSGALMAWENPPPADWRTEVKGSSIVAEVEGRPITISDLESGIAGMLYKARNEIYRMKLAQLEKLIQNALEERQTGRTPPQAGQPRSPDDPIAQQARQILIDTIRQGAHIDHYLEKPPLPYTRINAGSSPGMGPPDAPVTVIEFSDYLCPACKWAHPISQEIRKIYGDKLRWIFMDYPLNSHPGADKLAEAARCAGEQDRYWEFQDLLFAAQEHPDAARLKAFAQSLSMDIQSFDQCLQSAKYAGQVASSKQEGLRAGVNSTPSFIINGRLHPGSMTLENFKQRIDEALVENRD